ncbi:MAG: hypothetical protein R3F59_23415 [Myxococcota bacterium]
MVAELAQQVHPEPHEHVAVGVADDAAIGELQEPRGVGLPGGAVGQPDRGDQQHGAHHHLERRAALQRGLAAAALGEPPGLARAALARVDDGEVEPREHRLERAHAVEDVDGLLVQRHGAVGVALAPLDLGVHVEELGHGGGIERQPVLALHRLGDELVRLAQVAELGERGGELGGGLGPDGPLLQVGGRGAGLGGVAQGGVEVAPLALDRGQHLQGAGVGLLEPRHLRALEEVDEAHAARLELPAQHRDGGERDQRFVGLGRGGRGIARRADGGELGLVEAAEHDQRADPLQRDRAPPAPRQLRRPPDGRLGLVAQVERAVRVAGAEQGARGVEQPADGVARAVGAEEVPGHALIVDGRAQLEVGEHQLVQPREAPAVRRAPQQALPHHGVREAPRRARVEAHRQAPLHQRLHGLDRGEQVGRPRHPLPLLRVDAHPEHRRELHRAPHGLGERQQRVVEVRRPQRVQVVGQGRLGALHQPEPALRLLQDPARHPVLEQRHGEGRVAAGARGHAPRQLALEAHEFAHELDLVVVRQRVDPDPLYAVEAGDLAEQVARGLVPGEPLVLRHQHEQHGRGLDLAPAQHPAREEQRIGGAVGVVDDQDDGTPRAHGAQVARQGGDALRGARGALVERDLGEDRLVLRHHRPERGGGLLHARAHLAGRQAVEAEVGAHHRGEAARALLPAVVDPHRRGGARLVGLLGQPPRQVRLARAGRPLDDDGAGQGQPVDLHERVPQQVALHQAPDGGHGAGAQQPEAGAAQVQPAHGAGAAPVVGRRRRRVVAADGARDGQERGRLAEAARRLGQELELQAVVGLDHRHEVHVVEVVGVELLEGPGGVGRALGAARGVLVEQLAQPVLEAVGHRLERVERREVLFEVRPARLLPARAAERRGAGDERPHEAAEAVQVGPRPEVAPPVEELLGRHVGRGARAEQHGVGVGQVGEPEVGDDGAPLGRQQHVRRLEVAVDDAAGVGVGQRVEHHAEQVAQVGPHEAAAVLPEGAARQQVHHEVRGAGLEGAARGVGGVVGDLAQVVDADDVRVVEARDGAGLLAELADAARPARALARQHLDRHGHVVAAVDGAPDLRHAAAPDALLERERAEHDPAHGGGLAGGIHAS